VAALRACFLPRSCLIRTTLLMRCEFASSILWAGGADEQCKPTPHIITVATSWVLIVLRWLPRRQLAAEQSRDGNPGCICKWVRVNLSPRGRCGSSPMVCLLNPGGGGQRRADGRSHGVSRQSHEYYITLGQFDFTYGETRSTPQMADVGEGGVAEHSHSQARFRSGACILSKSTTRAERACENIESPSHTC